MLLIEIVYFNFNFRKYQTEYIIHRDIYTLKGKLESKIKELQLKGYPYTYDYRQCENRYLYPH
jgi:hypothetical protein